MAKTAMPLSQDPKYEKFLHASVGHDQKGIVVSVLSMLARLGIDPWREAAELAGLPEGSARKRLNALTATFSDVPSLAREHRAIVARLIDLLPRRPTPLSTAPPVTPLSWLPVSGGPPFYAIIMIVLLLTQLLLFRS